MGCDKPAVTGTCLFITSTPSDPGRAQMLRQDREGLGTDAGPSPPRGCQGGAGHGEKAAREVGGLLLFPEAHSCRKINPGERSTRPFRVSGEIWRVSRSRRCEPGPGSVRVQGAGSLPWLSAASAQPLGATAPC